MLVALAGTTRPLTGREVARLVRRGSQGGVNRALQRLVKHGVVIQQLAGRSHLFILNREHIAAPIAATLRDLRSTLIARIRDTIRSWPLAPRHASLFGSMARGDGDTDSDIDLFLVRLDTVPDDAPGWREQVDGLSEKVFAWTGNRLGVSEVSEHDVRSLRKRRPSIVQDLERDGIQLAGQRLDSILGAVR